MKNSIISGIATHQNTSNSSHQRYRNIIIEVISALLILLFLYTSTSKFTDFKNFYGEINGQPLPNWMTPYLVWAIPIIEILISMALFFSNTRKVGLWGSLILMSLFTIYTSTVLLNVYDKIPCSCGGVIRQLSWGQHLVFNLFFVAISLWAVLLSSRNSVQKENEETPPVVFT
jgi:putative oxidoreductase